MEAKLIVCILAGVFFGPVISLVITPIFCLLRVIFYVPFIRRKLLEKAKEDGHVVEAHLIKHHTISPDDNGPYTTMKEMGTYIYYVNGRKYKYHAITDAIPGLDNTMPLYYIKNPRKATTGGDLGIKEQPWLKIYLISSLTEMCHQAI